MIRLHKLDAARRVWLLTASLGAVALVFATQTASLPAPSAPFRISWPLLTCLFLAAEIFVVHLPLGRNTHSISLSEVPLLGGLFFASPAEVVLARLVGAAIALVYRRQSRMKFSFNLVAFALETSLAASVFHAIAISGDPLAPRNLIAALAAVATADILAVVCITLAMSLHEGRLLLSTFAEGIALGGIGILTNSALAMIGATVVWRDPRAAWLLGLIGATLIGAYRGFARFKQRYGNLELLYESTKVGRRSDDLEAVLGGLLHEARKMFRVELAEIRLLPWGEGKPGARVVLDGESQGRLESLDDVAQTFPAAGDDAFFPRGSAQVPHGLRDAMCAALAAEGGALGGLLVGNRLDDVSTFDAEDLRLLQAFGNHAGVAIANAQLVDRLREESSRRKHQATHDSLTGLPNRSLFHEHVARALRDRRGDPGVAVLLLDLDRFKEVNDTLGHSTGDLLVCAVGDVLRDALREEDLVARLGGDEFAVAITNLSSPAEAEEVAQRILRCFETPLQLDDLSLEVGASIGIAHYPDHGADAESLLQRADVAMYLAKSSGSGYEVYSPERDHYSPERLQLIGELRRAIEEGELAVFYQPKVDVKSGTIIGAEALLRWFHPRHGLMPPNDFIPLAEHAGLIGPLTIWVLNEALRECVRWNTGRDRLSVAVNLPARLLVDRDFPGEVARLLAAWGLPAALLTLEITETTIMTDPVRSIATLEKLAGIGVQISVDDFGTGYSSLAYLRRLPVHEMKIDKSFVLGMESVHEDGMIVRAAAELGHNLGLRVVAEGVESEAIWRSLASIGCDVAQGYHFGAALEAGEFRAHLGRRFAPAGGPETDADPERASVLVLPRVRPA